MDYSTMYRGGMLAMCALSALVFAGMGLLDMRTAFEIAGACAMGSMPSLVKGA